MTSVSIVYILMLTTSVNAKYCQYSSWKQRGKQVILTSNFLAYNILKFDVWIKDFKHLCLHLHYFVHKIFTNPELS